MSLRNRLHVDRGGANDAATLLLLHGLGANASVWKPLLREIAPQWPGRWLAPDLRGHGLSPFEAPYGFATHAADVAELVAAEVTEADGPLVVVGHSFGGVVGALLASGLYGPEVAGLFAFGVKLQWTPGEVAKARELSRKPPRVFPERRDAVTSYLRGAGLVGLLDPEADDALAAVAEVEGGYRVRLDPRVFACAGPPIPPLFERAKCPLRLAAGDADPMVNLAQLQRVDPGAVVLAKAGHNAHVEQPAAVWKAIAEMCKQHDII